MAHLIHKKSFFAQKIKYLNYLKYSALTLIIIIVLFLLYTFVLVKPSNTRKWEIGMDVLPSFVINNDKVTIHNVRNFHYSNDQTDSYGYLDRFIDAKDITRVWFVVEPFTVQPFSNFGGVAHTYFVFDVKNQDPIVVSVEARREKGEKYDSWLGLFNKYELMYIWGTESDETGRRVIVEHNKLYMYPLTIPHQDTEQLFLHLTQTSQDLETHPRFYNTLTSNCTNELAKVANEIEPNAIPFNIALFLPGYSPQELYKLGYIPKNVSLDTLKQKYFISDLVKQTYSSPDFSQQLREKLSSQTGLEY